jgi:L-ascorbate metabolism protein UlaG (beta-lactamase superfamily)
LEIQLHKQRTTADVKTAAPGLVRRATAAARSGLRRYPRHLLHSLRDSVVARDRLHPHVPGLQLDNFASSDLSAVWVGHATVLLHVAGLNILTDPVFSHRIGMSIGSRTFGLGRVLPLPLDVHHLPRVDLILISHAHFDHLDKPSLRRLASRTTTVVTAANTRRLIPHGFKDVVELDWDGEVRFGEGRRRLRLTAVRPQHWGARTALDKHRGFNSYVIEAPGQRLLFAGDTAHTDVFDRVGPVRLAAFGIGAYEPWIHAHASPEQVWSMFSRMGGDYLLPMHHSTFDLGDEAHDEPLRRLMRAARGHHDRIVCRQPGHVWRASA